MEKTILAAIDGSVYSANSLDYLALLFAGDRKLTIRLLQVVATSAEKAWMNDVDPLRSQMPGDDKHTLLARKHLKSAQERLIHHGFTPDQIQTEVRNASSICQAIRGAAEQGQVDAVLIGRRGMGAMGAMLLGSTSMDLVEKCTRNPLWIVDGTITSTRFLLAVHGHPSSLMAADHLAFMLKGVSNAEILLYHSKAVFGKQAQAEPKDFHAQWGKEWCDKYLDMENYLFYAHTQLLVDGGFPRHRIKQLPMQMHMDVSSDLIRQAHNNNCGTIVIGRRRRDLNRGQLKGVSDKTLKQAENVAVWLAG